MKRLIIIALFLLSFSAYSNDFNYVWDKIIEFEGKTIDKDCGSSKYGITNATLKSYNKNMKLQNLTEKDAKLIAYKLIYEPNLLSFINDNRKSLILLDWIFNSNPINATKHIQKVLGLKVDGLFSIEDIKFINSLEHSHFVNVVLNARLRYMKRLSVYPKFKNGWVKRLETLRKITK